jgi:DNA-binding Lrp family transcriptional regulator
MDASDRQILALLVEDGRRTYDDIAQRVSLSPPAVSAASTSCAAAVRCAALRP